MPRDSLTSPDLPLLLAMHAGDPAAARTLYARIGPRLLAALRLLTRNHAAAEDASQQAFLRVLRLSHQQLAEIEDVQAWLVTTARRLALNDIRTAGRAHSRERIHAAMASARAAHDRAPAASFPGFDDLAHALDKLSDDDRELIILKHVAGLTFEQLALALDINRNTLATRYRAAVARLYAALNNRPNREISHAR